jgi:hypothetical protein
MNRKTHLFALHLARPNLVHGRPSKLHYQCTQTGNANVTLTVFDAPPPE